MKITSITSLSIPDVKVIHFRRFIDHRGYFTEHYRKSDFKPVLDVEFFQCNESYSKAGTVRGLHFQWNPYMGKLVRTVYGRMSDIVLDIRKGSPTFGKAVILDMPAHTDGDVMGPRDYTEWIWVPPGFAHGNFFDENTIIEYFCSGEHSPGCESGICPFAKDIDWSLAEPKLKQQLDMLNNTTLITDKDKNAFTLEQWVTDERSNNFIYGKL